MNQTSQPCVSVILPILNEERDLENCISAILQQDYSASIEVILALGPSKDKTTQIAKALSAGDSRIKLVDNPSGQTAAGLNLAIKSSSHEIICRIDGHSEIESDYIKNAVAIMHQTGAVNVGGLMHANSELMIGLVGVFVFYQSYELWIAAKNDDLAHHSIFGRKCYSDNRGNSSGNTSGRQEEAAPTQANETEIV